MKKQQVLRLLREARVSATLLHAGFDDIGGSTLVRLSPDGKLRRCEPVNETEYIKERTALYRQSWIIGPLDSAIALIERK